MNPILECHSVTKTYRQTPALQDLSLVLEPGQIVGLLGPNGSGKTTFIKLLAGLLQPDAGQILIAGGPVGTRTKGLVSYLPDKPALKNRTKVSGLLQLFSDFYADFIPERAREMLDSLGISPDARMGELSKGTQEKVQLILVMSRKARLYLLDEPVGGVDPAARDYILRTIISNYEEDATVLLSTHLIADVEQVLDYVLFLQNGRLLLSDSVDHIRSQHGKSVDSYFREVFRC